MDKTTSISLGGYAFTLDNSAFNYLKNYLDQIRRSLGNTEGVDEILADVEARIAELLKEKLGDGQVASNADILSITEQMGKPEDYSEGDDLDDESSNARTGKGPTIGIHTGRKLFRDISDAWIGGVCSGIARYLDIDSIWIRVLFVAVAFLDIFTWIGISTTVVIVTYIAMWIIIPEAQSTADKLRMQGRPVNLDSIKEFAENTASNVSKAANDVSPRAGEALRTIGKILLVIIGIWLAIQGFALILGGVAGFVVFTSGLIPPSEYLQMTLGWDIMLYLGFACAALAIIIPGVLLLILAFRIFSERFAVKARYVWTLVAFWLIAALAAGGVAVNKSKDFWRSGYTKEIINLPVTSDTLTIAFDAFKIKDTDNGKRWIESDDHLFELEGTIYHRNVDWSVHPTTDDQVSMEIKYKAQGASEAEAQENTKDVAYSYSLQKNRLQLDDYMKLSPGKRFKGQRIELRIYIPEGITVFSENMDQVSFGDDDEWGGYDTKRNAKGKYYRFTDGEFRCLNCLTDCEDCEDNHNHDRHTKKSWRITSDEGEETSVEISNEKGLRIENEANKIIVNKDSIYIKDDSDSVRVNINGN